MFKSKAHLYPERSTAGTVVYKKTAEIINPLPKAVPCTWSTAVRGLTATQHAQRSEISRRDRRWTLSSSSCTWDLMCRRWPISRAWTQVSYWACSAAAAKYSGRTHFPSVRLIPPTPLSHLSFDLRLTPAFSRGSVPTLLGLPSLDPLSWFPFCSSLYYYHWAAWRWWRCPKQRFGTEPLSDPPQLNHGLLTV